MINHFTRPIQLVLLGASVLLGFAQEPAQKDSEEGRAAVLAKQSTIYEQFNVSVTFQEGGRWEKEEYCRARVESEAGVQHMGKLRFGYGAENQRVEILMARVIKKDGTTVDAGPDSILEVSQPFAGLGNHYSDYREKHLLVPGLQPGDTVEYRVKTVEHTPFAPRHFWHSYRFFEDEPCLAEVLKVVVPSGREIKLRYKPKHVPAIRDENGWTTYEWKSSHIPRDESEQKEEQPKKKSHKEFREEARPDVELTTFQNWEEFASWYRPLQKSRMAVTEELRQKTAELIRDCKTDTERIEAIYSFVATGVRYVSVSLGIGRFVPHSAADVLNHLYGDCKDKHTLLATMLQIAGFEACPVLTHSGGEVDEDMPSPTEFDHVLTLVHSGGSELWLDSTSETAPFRVLSSVLCKKAALVVHLDGSSLLTKIPAVTPFDFNESVEIDAKLSENGTITGKVNHTIRGDEEILWRAAFRARPPSDWQKVAQFLHRALALPGDVTSVHASDPLDTHQPFALEYEFSGLLNISQTERTKETVAGLPLPRFPAPWAVIDDAPDPEPIDLGYARKKTAHLRLKLPQGFIDRAPLPVSVKRDYGEYESKYELIEDTLIAERRLDIRLSEIDGKRAPEHVSFRRAVEADGAQQLVPKDDFLTKRLMAEKKNAARLLESGMRAFDSRDYQTAVKLLKQVVELEPDHRYAWNNLGRCYNALGQWETAIEVFRKQMAINPYDEYAYNNLGWSYANLGRLAEAEQAYRKQLEIAPLDQWAHKNLGYVLAEQEKYAEALPELEKALTISPADIPLQQRLGSVLFHVGQPERGYQELEKVLQAAPTPPFWNNTAYTMAEFGYRLDLAQQYADSAVQGVRTALLNVPTTGKFCCPQIVDSVGSYWDTLGFIFMQKGDYNKAEKYILPAWELSQHGECGLHLGEIYLKQGDKQRAIKQFARALAAFKPPAKVRAQLTKLVEPDKVDGLVALAGEELIRMRTVEVTPGVKEDLKADFLIILSPNTAPEVSFISGNEKLRPYEEHLKKAQIPFRTPEHQPTRILRRGELKCSADAGTCALILELPRNVRSLEATATESGQNP